MQKEVPPLQSLTKLSPSTNKVVEGEPLLHRVYIKTLWHRMGLPYSCHFLAKNQNFNLPILDPKAIFKGFYVSNSLI